MRKVKSKIRKKDEKYFRVSEAEVTGIIDDEFQFSYDKDNKVFYRTKIKVYRRSGTPDYIPVVVEKSMFPKDFEKLKLKGKIISVKGQFQSKKYKDENKKNHLDLFLFASFIEISEFHDFDPVSQNYVFLKGFICQDPVYRHTPFGKEIADLFIVVNRNGGSDCIPCIAWHFNAEYVREDLHIGDRIIIEGRIQSRKYFKRYSLDGEDGEYKEVCEVSIKKIEKIES